MNKWTLEELNLVPMDEHHFTGKEGDHNITRVTCRVCKEVLSEMHFSCCGYSSCGSFQTSAHVCKEGK